MQNLITISALSRMIMLTALFASWLTAPVGAQTTLGDPHHPAVKVAQAASEKEQGSEGQPAQPGMMAPQMMGQGMMGGMMQPGMMSAMPMGMRGHMMKIMSL